MTQWTTYGEENVITDLMKYHGMTREQAQKEVDDVKKMADEYEKANQK